MVDESTVKAVEKYFSALRDSGIFVSFAVIFGSQARGITHEWSDIDLVVVSPVFDGAFDRADVFKLWRVAARTDSRIEPIPCGERQWIEDTESAVIEIARREGVCIRLAEAVPAPVP